MRLCERHSLWGKLDGGNNLPLSPHFNKYNGRLLVVGTAECVHGDLEKAEPYDYVMAVNFGVACCSPDFWASRHHEVFLPNTSDGYRLSQILDKPYPTDEDVLFISGDHVDHAGHKFPSSRAMHSGVFGCVAGLLLGFDHIQTAGIPADISDYFWGQKSPPFSREQIDRSWEMWRPELEGHLFPISGHLRELFSH